MNLENGPLFESAEEIFVRVFCELKPRTAPPPVRVSYRRFANANSFIRMDQGGLEVKITDVLDGAPAPILEALAHILLSKLLRKSISRTHRDRYRRYLNRTEMRRSLHLLRQERGRKFVSGPAGRQYNLEQLFEELNGRFFHGLMARPLLGWSRRPSRTTLGHYDPSHNAIILSSVLDSSSVPQLAVEYVMFHEMLHLRYPVDHRGSRRCVHTPEFKAAERLFPSWQSAKALLRQL